MALFELEQHTGEKPTAQKAPTFKDCAAADVGVTFFNEREHAEWHTVDGKKALVIVEEEDLREHSAHWEAGAKQNFDTGLYTAYAILYIRAEEYGPKPKVGKPLVLDTGTDHQRTYEIRKCSDERGVYRMTMLRKRQ